jgi:DNA-directed RNA polymerase specialized sigma24 family protein
MQRRTSMTIDAYGHAYEAGFERTIRFLISRGAPRDRAQEVAQSAWVHGLESLRQLRDDKLIIAWVNAIALNVYRRFLQRETMLQPLEYSTAHYSVDLSLLDLNRALNACRPGDRALLERQMSGATTKEIAGDEGVSETAIRIRLHRARQSARLNLRIVSNSVR